MLGRECEKNTTHMTLSRRIGKRKGTEREGNREESTTERKKEGDEREGNKRTRKEGQGRVREGRRVKGEETRVKGRGHAKGGGEHTHVQVFRAGIQNQGHGVPRISATRIPAREGGRPGVRPWLSTPGVAR